MAKKKSGDKKPKSKMTLRDRIKADRAKIKEGSGNRDIIFIKEGTVRVRILNVGEENEWYVEVLQIYLPGIGGVFSPSTFGDDCALMEWYEEMKASSDEDDKALLQKISLSKRYLVPVVMYMDDKGKTIDESNSGKLLQLTKGLLTETMDNFLDDEWGDFTDPNEGYDIKYTREGKGKTDTTYTSNPCKPTKLAKPWGRKPIDLDEMIKKVVPTYEETKIKLAQFLSGDTSSSNEVDFEDMSRKELKSYIKEQDMDISVKKADDEKAIIKKIKRALKKKQKGDI